MAHLISDWSESYQVTDRRYNIMCVVAGLKQAVLFNGNHDVSGSVEGSCCKGCVQLNLGKRAVQFASWDG